MMNLNRLGPQDDAWFLGFLVCFDFYTSTPSTSFALFFGGTSVLRPNLVSDPTPVRWSEIVDVHLLFLIFFPSENGLFFLIFQISFAFFRILHSLCVLTRWSGFLEYPRPTRIEGGQKLVAVSYTEQIAPLSSLCELISHPFPLSLSLVFLFITALVCSSASFFYGLCGSQLMIFFFVSTSLIKTLGWAPSMKFQRFQFV